MNDFQQISEQLARRIGEITANYEAQLAVLLSENQNLKNQVDSLRAIANSIQPLDATVEPQLDGQSDD